MASQYLLPQNTVFSLLPIAPCVVSDQHHHHVHVGIRILWTFSVYLFTICMRFTPNRQKSATIILARSDKCSHCLIFMSVIRLLIVLNCADPVEWKCEWTKWICVCERERERDHHCPSLTIQTIYNLQQSKTQTAKAQTTSIYYTLIKVCHTEWIFFV